MVEHGAHGFLGSKIIHFQPHQFGHDPLRALIQHGYEQALLGAVVVVNQLLGNPRRAGYLFHAYTGEAFLREFLAGRLDQAADRIAFSGFILHGSFHPCLLMTTTGRCTSFDPG
ncbi:hypothetical protein D3C84_794210 [compost metagenome]